MNRTRLYAGTLAAAALVLGIWRSQLEPPARAGGRLELGTIQQLHASSGLRLERRAYAQSQGASAGHVLVAAISPARTRISVVPAIAPKPLHHILAGTRGDFVAINGGFYDADAPMGLVLAGQRVSHPLTVGGGSGVLVVGSNGAAIVHRSEFERGHAWYALQSIDRLVGDGEVLVNDRDGLPRDARSAVVIDDEGRVLFVTIVDARAVAAEKDGSMRLNRKSTTTGPTLHEFAELLSRAKEDGGFGAVEALNLDGGFSTAFHARVGGAEVRIEGFRGTINAVRAVPRDTPIPRT